MPLILGAQSATTAAVVVSNSCRFDVDEGTGLAATLGTPTDLDKWTFSTWCKLCIGTNAGGEEEGLFSCHIDASNYTQMGTAGVSGGSPSRLNLYNHLSGSASASLMANIFYRDPSAWYHVVWIWDSGNATEGDRVILYVNGTRVTNFYAETYPTQDDNSSINSANVHEVAEKDSTAAHNFNGYFAETVFIDGQALAASSFGEFDSDSPTIWKPIDVSGLTFGNNGFYLDYEDSADLGADASGNSHDFTGTNLDASDQSQDTPVNNFATLNPLYMPTSNDPVFSNGNNVVVTQNASGKYVGGASTLAMSSGLWYAEFELTDDTSDGLVGIVTDPAYDAYDNRWTGEGASDWGYASTDGNVYNAAGDTGSYGDTYATGDIIGLYLDLNANKMYWAKNGTVQNSGTGRTIAAGTYFFSCSDFTTASSTWSSNFGNGCFGSTAVTSSNTDANGYGSFEYDPSAGTFDS